jgi:hypothetical protein
MKKRSWLLFVLIALLWWLGFYAGRRKAPEALIPRIAAPRPSLKEIEEKEKALKEELLKKARQTFRESKGREAEDINELIEEGLIRADTF